MSSNLQELAKQNIFSTKGDERENQGIEDLTRASQLANVKSIPFDL